MVAQGSKHGIEVVAATGSREVSTRVGADVVTAVHDGSGRVCLATQTSQDHIRQVSISRFHVERSSKGRRERCLIHMTAANLDPVSGYGKIRQEQRPTAKSHR